MVIHEYESVIVCRITHVSYFDYIYIFLNIFVHIVMKYFLKMVILIL